MNGGLALKLRISAEKLRQMRLKAGWTQERLAEEAGLHGRTVQRIESEGFLSVQSLDALSNAFEVEAGELLVEESPSSGVRYTPEEATEWVKSYAKAMERIGRWRSYGWVGKCVFLVGAILMVSCMLLVKENLGRTNILYVLFPGVGIGLALAAIGAFMASLSVRAEKEEKALRTMTQLQIPPWLKFD